MRREDPVVKLRPQKTPQVAKLVKAIAGLAELADTYNGIRAGLIVPGSQRNRKMLSWMLRLPMDGLGQRLTNIELAAKKMRKIAEDVSEQDDLDWPVTKEEEEVRFDDLAGVHAESVGSGHDARP